MTGPNRQGHSKVAPVLLWREIASRRAIEGGLDEDNFVHAISGPIVHFFLG